MDIILLLMAAFVIIYHFGYAVLMVGVVFFIELLREQIEERIEDNRVHELSRYGPAGAPKKPKLVCVVAAALMVVIAVADGGIAAYTAAVLSVSHAVIWNVVALSGRVPVRKASPDMIGMASWAIAGMGLLSATVVPLVVMSSVATL